MTKVSASDVRILRVMFSCLASVLAMVVLLDCSTSVWRAFADGPLPSSYSVAAAVLSVLLAWRLSDGAVETWLRSPAVPVRRKITPDDAFIQDMMIAMEGPDGEEPTRS